MMFVEHITKEDLAEHRRRMSANLRLCHWLSRGNVLAALVVVGATYLGQKTLARVALFSIVPSAAVVAWVAWRGWKEQRDVMRLLLADVEQLRRLTEAEIERRGAGDIQ